MPKKMTDRQRRALIGQLCDLQKKLTTTVCEMIDYANDPTLGGDWYEGLDVLARTVAHTREGLSKIPRENAE